MGWRPVQRELSASAAWAAAFPPSLASPDGCLPSLPFRLPVKRLARGLPSLSGGEITGLREVTREPRTPSSFTCCIKSSSQTVRWKAYLTLGVFQCTHLGAEGKSPLYVFNSFKGGLGTALVAWHSRVHLPVQGSQVPSLVRKDSTCHGATETMCHNH